MFGLIGKALSGMAGFFGNKAAHGVGDAMAGKISDKIAGIPDPMSGAEMGAEQMAFQNAAYPGTTPWERLGQGSIMGQIEGGNIAARNAQKLQNRQLSQQSTAVDKQTGSNVKIAELNNAASLESARRHAIASAAGQGTEVLENVLNAIDRKPIKKVTVPSDKSTWGTAHRVIDYGKAVLSGAKDLFKDNNPISTGGRLLDHKRQRSLMYHVEKNRNLTDKGFTPSGRRITVR